MTHNKLYCVDREARLNFLNWFLHREYDAEIELQKFYLAMRLSFI
jgi:hypothetical protein